MQVCQAMGNKLPGLEQNPALDLLQRLRLEAVYNVYS